MIRTLSLLLFVNLTTSIKEIPFLAKNNFTSGPSFREQILCRGCGNDITFSSSLISKSSQSSQYSYKDSLFSKDEVLIQVLQSDFFLPYLMITTTQSNCIGISEWEEADPWYPGYRMRLCVCPDCGAHVGWVFEPIHYDFADEPRTFFGLILTSLIGESFINSVTIFPGDRALY